MGKRLKIVMVASECSGFAKVGGLGDVVHDLSVELCKIDGNKVSVIIPYYESMDIQPDFIDTITVDFGNESYKTDLYLLIKEGVRFYFISNKIFFGGRYKHTYIDSFKRNKGPFEDDAKRFAFFSKAALTLIDEHDEFLNTDILHCHDWHTGFIFPFLKYDSKYERLRDRIKTVFTIHNLQYQGIRPYLLEKDINRLSSFRSWFGELYKTIDNKKLFSQISYPANISSLLSVEFHRLQHSWKIDSDTKNLLKNSYKPDITGKYYELSGEMDNELKIKLYNTLLQCSILCFNPIRSGINLSDQINTVSKTYSIEITYPDDYKNHLYRGCGLENDLKEVLSTGKLDGIINGIDYKQYDPKKLENGYSIDDDNWSNIKEENKKYLLGNMVKILKQLRKKIGNKFKNYPTVMKHLKKIDMNRWLNKPLFVSIGRASEQKVGILFESYDEKELLIEELAGRDGFFIFVGSGEYEKQLEILNTFPNAVYITAFEYNFGLKIYSSGDIFIMPSYYEPCGISQLIAMRYATVPLVNDVGGLHDTVIDSVTGFKYSYSDEYDHKTGLIKGVDRVISCYMTNRNLFREIQANAMQVKFGWEKSAREYIDLYNR